MDGVVADTSPSKMPMQITWLLPDLALFFRLPQKAGMPWMMEREGLEPVF